MIRSRAALLPFTGDPFLLNYWLKFYDKYWHDEVDYLYILHNSSVEKQVVDYIRGLCKSRPKVILQYNNLQIEHGDVINSLLGYSKEDYIMLIEDDAFVFKSGQVDKCFRIVESEQADVVGSKRGSCSDEILKEAKRLWNLEYTGEGDQGPNFWPCYFFCKRDVLESTDRHFGAKAWKRGEKVKALNDYIVQGEIIAGDTMVHTSLQLRSKGYKFHYENHYHGSPDDLLHFKQGYNLWDGVAPWTHIGSLSSGVGGVLVDDEGFSLSKRGAHFGKKSIESQKPNTLQEKNEWERRTQWWLTFYQNRDEEEIPEFAELYMMAINRLIGTFELNMNNIRLRQKAYSLLGL